MTKTMSPAGRAALMRREGCRLAAYLDSVGVPTIGIGHTGRAGLAHRRHGHDDHASRSGRDLRPPISRRSRSAVANRAVTVRR